MDSDVIRPLYDTENGGPARAFECLLLNWVRPGVKGGKHCGVVTRTLRGMRSHQLYSHAFKPQAKIPFSGKDEQWDSQSQSRKRQRMDIGMKA